MRGHIERRSLISTFVDPDEAARRLPPSLRPHVVGGGTVVGICVLELARVRPDGVPAALGRSLRAAAHRISVEWDTDDGVEVGVFVPIRLTDSLLASTVGGRLVPGAHQRVPVSVEARDGQRRSAIGSAEHPFHVEVGVTVLDDVAEAASCDALVSTCVGARIGLSPARRGGLDAIRMDVAHHRVATLEVDHLVSPWLASFSTAGAVDGRMLADAGVRWSPAVGPASTLLRRGEQQARELAGHRSG